MAFPKTAQPTGTFLLGKSLIESGQFDEGLQTLDELLAGKLPADDPHRVRSAAPAGRHMPHRCRSRELDKALEPQHGLVHRTRISRTASAPTCCCNGPNAYRGWNDSTTRGKRCDAIPADGRIAAGIALMRGKIELDEIAAALRTHRAERRGEAAQAIDAKIAEAIAHLQKAQELDAEKTAIARQSSYQLGRGLELQGDTDAALKQFARTRQFYGETFEGLAAALAEADLLREKGDIEGGRARLSSRAGVVRSDPRLSQPRAAARRSARATDGRAEGLRRPPALRRSAHALDRFPAAVLARRTAGASRRHARAMGQPAGQPVDRRTMPKPTRRARRDCIICARPASPSSSWPSCASPRSSTRPTCGAARRTTFSGHSFTRTIELLNEYLEYEPELRNAEALLRLGQAHLALGQVPQSIAAFEECIEFHPLDGSTYQARIDCAKAYWHQGNTSRAEQLLRDNIAGSTLKPSSREWKDSLFELGMLLHETGQYEEAIGTLEEAVERYPQDPQRLVAQYVIGESYRRWARELLDARRKLARTSERDKNASNWRPSG